jgi:antitoxin component HigA of HigAB toxin-antitoxin module
MLIIGGYMPRKSQFNEDGIRIKKCPKCGETKDVSQWYWRDKEHTILSTYCIPCDNTRKTLYARKKFSNRSEREKENLRQRLWKRNITLEQYEQLLKLSNNACEICSSKEDLVIDHCHTTNKIRGILCWSCNVALGHFKDNMNNLKNAQDYLCKKS